MSDWKIVIPREITNIVYNPSAEAAGNYSTANGSTLNRVTTLQVFGAYSYSITGAGAVLYDIGFTTEAFGAGSPYTVSCYASGSWQGNLRAVLGGSTGTLAKVYDIDDNWALYSVELTPGIGASAVTIQQDQAGACNFYLDGVQVEEGSDWTTFCDGDQKGCYWKGAEHGSASIRSAASRAGGIVRDLEDTYDLNITGMIGTEASPQNVYVDEYALTPGGALNNIKVQPRFFTITGDILSTSSRENFHQIKQALLSVITPNAYPKDEAGSQPVILWYMGAEVIKQISCHYVGGLEGSIKATDPCYLEKVGIQFVAPDPNFYAISNEAVTLDVEDSATFKIVGGRLLSSGQWDDLGPPAAGGTYSEAYDAVVGDDKVIYYCGSFLNFDNDANSDYIVQYDQYTGTWSSLGSGANGIVYKMVIGPNGNLYAGGAFTTMGGGAANRIAVWNGAAWAALGAGLDNTVTDMAFDSAGNLIIVGGFTDVQGGPGGTYNYVVSWDGAAYNALGTGLNNNVEGVSTDNNGNVYVTGSFTTAGGSSAARVAKWDGSAWTAMGDGLANNVGLAILYALGNVYVAGSFTSLGNGITTEGIAKWNGQSWEALGGGLDNNGREMAMGPDNLLYVVGNFNQAGDVTANGIAKWNGSSWSHLDFDVPITNRARGIALGQPDPAIKNNYDIFIAFDNTGAGSYAGSTTITSQCTEKAYPIIKITRSGGTSAQLWQIKNETNGLYLLFEYDLLDGETLEIDLTPLQRKVKSSFFGSIPKAVLGGSDFSEFSILPDRINQFTCFVDNNGATITARMFWKRTYWSQD